MMNDHGDDNVEQRNTFTNSANYLWNCIKEIVSEKKVWIEQEDRALINNYDTFKEL